MVMEMNAPSLACSRACFLRRSSVECLWPTQLAGLCGSLAGACFACSQAPALDRYFATKDLPVDIVYYIVALVAHATKTHDVKDLGFYNF